MANINLSGSFKNSLGAVDVGGIFIFTHETTTGNTIATTPSELVVTSSGTYSINLEYGQIKIEYMTKATKQFIATVIVNSDTVATSLPELLNAAAPVTPAVIFQMQTILADAVTAENGAVTAKNSAVTAENAAVTARDVAVAASIIQYQTFAELLAISETVDYKQYTVAERANAAYILQPAGYAALAGDATLVNGRVAKLQIDLKGMNVLSFGATYDSAMLLAIDRMGNVPIIVAANSSTAGIAKTSAVDTNIQILDGVTITLANGSDAGVFNFIASTNISVTGGEIDGNKDNQSAPSSTSNALSGIYFDLCTGVKVTGVNIINTSACAVRALDSSDVKVSITGSGAGYIPIYIGPRGTGGVSVNNIKVFKCDYDWTTVDRLISERTLCSVTTTDAALDINDITINDNIFRQTQDAPSGLHACIAVRSGNNYSVSSNKCYGGGIPITLVSGSDGFACFGNTVEGAITLYAIEIAGGATNWAVYGNILKGTGAAVTGIQVNGGSSFGTVDGNTVKGFENGCKVAPNSLAENSTDVSFNSNIIDVSNQCYSLKYTNGFSISGGVANTTDSTSIINLESCDDGLISHVKTKATSTFFVRVSGTEQTMNELLVTSNKTNVLAQNDRYIKDVTSGLGIGANIKYLSNSNGPNIRNLQGNIMDLEGTGTPQGSVVAGVGSTYIDFSGGAGATFYVKETLTTSSGWVGK